MLIVVFYGEGCVEVWDDVYFVVFESKGLVVLCYVDNFGKVIEIYLVNLNGLLNGIMVVMIENGWVMIMMLYLECVFCIVVNFWYLENWGEDSLWMCIFCNVCKQLGQFYLLLFCIWVVL